MQTALSRFWTRVAVSISHDNNQYIPSAIISVVRFYLSLFVGLY